MMKHQNLNRDVCSHKHAFFLDNIFRKWFQNPDRIVGEYISKGDVVIDLGCGPGFFSIEMAKMAGSDGCVYSVDLQKEMLDKVDVKALKNKVNDRIVLHQCLEGRIGLDETIKADFILAYYMMHEVPDQAAVLKEVKLMLKPGGRFLIVEPIFHVSRKAFEVTIKTAEKIGFHSLERPAKKGGRSLLLTLP